MQLAPVYGDAPLIELDGDPTAIGPTTMRQRRRLVSILRELDRRALAAPTRCEGWTTRDVASHLESATRFWTLSIRSALGGEPTRYLANFDPVAVPAQIVATDRRSDAEVVDALDVATEQLATLLEPLSPSDWTVLAEGPPGHITIDALAHHGHWDAWTHERDILLPQGAQPAIEPDEVIAALRYAACLGPALTVSLGTHRAATLEIRTTDPEATVTVEVDDRVRSRVGAGMSTPDLVLVGDAVELTEALSVRVPLAVEVDPADRWLVDGLQVVFDQTTT